MRKQKLKWRLFWAVLLLALLLLALGGIIVRAAAAAVASGRSAWATVLVASGMTKAAPR